MLSVSTILIYVSIFQCHSESIQNVLEKLVGNSWLCPLYLLNLFARLVIPTGQLVLGHLITWQAGFPIEKLQALTRKRKGKLFIRNLNVRTSTLSKDLFWAENGIIENPGSPQKPPFFPFRTQFTTPSKGCLFSNLVPVYLIIYVPIYALSFIIVIIMYVCWLNILSKKEISAALLDIILHLKRMHFTSGKLSRKEKNRQIKS